MGIIHYLLKNEKQFPDKKAIVFADIILTYRDVSEQTRKLSSALSRIGIGNGNHIGILLNNSVEFVIALLAAADLGATVVPMNTTLSYNDFSKSAKVTDIDYIIGWHTVLKNFFKHSNQSFQLPHQNCISVGGKIDNCHFFDEILETASSTYKLGKHTIDDETDFILTMTSGSTSDPKPIVFTQGTKIRRALGAQELYDITEKDITIVATPLYHSISQRLVLLPIITGGTCVIMQKFASGSWLSHIDRHQVTFSIVVSSQLEMILKELRYTEADMTSLRSLVSCCALLKEDIKTSLIKEIKCNFHECYGTSEVGIVSDLSFKDEPDKLHTVGKPAPGVEIKIVDNDSKEIPIGKIGEIACKSPMRFSRYYKNVKATKQSIVNDFFLTGDMGYYDKEGYLAFSGRKKEIIITGGINVYPRDVEAVLNSHDKVNESVVIGVEDERFGEAVLALIIPLENEVLTIRELQRYCFDHLADFQQPMAFIFTDDFPRTELGKITKHKLVEQYRGYDITSELRTILNKS